MAAALTVQMERRREVGGSKYGQTAMNMGSAGCVCAAAVKGCLAYRGDDEARVL